MEQIEIPLPSVSAIVVAAGSSSRMGGGKNKIFLELAGKPVIAHTLAAFDEASLVNEVIVVTREDCIVPLWDIVKFFKLKKVAKIITGGTTRQGSVINGVAEVSDKMSFFCIHDGARPLISPKLINRVIFDAILTNAAVLGVKAKDTIKRADENGYIVDTLQRDMLYNIQTPQVFERKLFMEAIRVAFSTQSDYTDDCQMVEALGTRILVTQGDYSNIKITTPDDIAVAESILNGQKNMPEPHTEV